MAHERLDAMLEVDGSLKGLGPCEIVDLAFYDGPLSGVILFADAPAVRLRAIASNYRWGLRAFELGPMRLGWEARAGALAELVEKHRGGQRQETMPMSADAFEDATRTLEAVPVESRYVAVGDSWLTRLLVAPVSKAEVVGLCAMDERAAFRAAHRLVKQHRRSRSAATPATAR